MSFDREDATTETVTSRYGSAFTPTFLKMAIGWFTGVVLKNIQV